MVSPVRPVRLTGPATPDQSAWARRRRVGRVRLPSRGSRPIRTKSGSHTDWTDDGAAGHPGWASDVVGACDERL